MLGEDSSSADAACCRNRLRLDGMRCEDDVTGREAVAAALEGGVAEDVMVEEEFQSSRWRAIK